MSVNGEIDRASWARYSSSGPDRCLICGHSAQVKVIISATEIDKGQGGTLATQKFTFCDEHGTLRFGGALAFLQTGSSRQNV